MILFYITVDQQKVFFQRYEGGLVEIHLATYHHHNMPIKLQIDVDLIEQKCSSMNGTKMVMNKQYQVIAHRWTYSTNNKEQGPLAQELCNFFVDRSQLDALVIYLDKCCEDAVWIKTKLPKAHVIVDYHHLITRCSDNSDERDKARHALFMKDISKLSLASMELQCELDKQLMKTYQRVSQFLVQQSLNFMHPEAFF